MLIVISVEAKEKGTSMVDDHGDAEGNMKTYFVEIHDDQIIAVLQETIRTAWITSQPRRDTPEDYESQNMADAITYSKAANHVIRWFGGTEVDIHKIKINKIKKKKKKKNKKIDD